MPRQHSTVWGKPAAIVATAVVASLAPPGAAQAQGVPSNDPGADSPAGFIYQIPLDTARGVAAPRRNRRAGVDGSGHAPQDAGPPASAIRSENNFGSSSIVPGARSPLGSPKGSGGDAAGRAASRSVSAPLRPGRPKDARRVAAVKGAPSSDDSGSPVALTIPLLLLTVAVGVGAGTAAARSRR